VLLGWAPARADVLGQWDFSQGWNQSSGVVASSYAIPGLTLSYLPKTPIYQVPAAQGQPNPPQVQFATTGSFGIGNLGSTSNSVVMQMPDMRGYGLVTGLMGSFPQRSNGDGSPAHLNRYSIVMDVYIPGSTYGQLPPDTAPYLTLLQTRLGVDGAWFIEKVSQDMGVAASYGGDVLPDAWNRLALVMNLSDSATVPHYQAYINGTLVATHVPADVPQDSSRSIELVTGYPDRDPPVPPDLFTDGRFSIASLNTSYPGLGTSSAFFLFNADRNNSIDGPTKGELGTLYVANLQFRDDAMTGATVAALGGAAPGVIPVPEPATLGLLAAAALAATGWSARRRAAN
jgi:hypothetical protein